MKTSAIRRELRVAFSPRAQPVWFRVIKWTCIVVGAMLFHEQRCFWWTLASLAAAGTLLHFFYRWKTKGWTRAWGGWKDLAAGGG
jgi:hypothetical protein